MNSVAEYFDEMSAIWDDAVLHNKTYIREVLKLLKIKEGDKIADVGCGTGVLIDYIREINRLGTITEIDISQKMLNMSRAKNYSDDNIKYLKLDINNSKLDELFDALEYYYQQTNRRITLEYILLKDINDSLQDARELAKYAQRLNCYINLIPYNETGVFKRSTIEARDAFFNELNKLRVNAIIRKEHGHDIDAACGQLRVKRMNSGKQ